MAKRYGKPKSPISRKLRSSVIKRDDYACTVCEARRKRLYMHHVVPEKDGGATEAANLVSVCQDCHVEIHRQQRAAENKLYAERRKWTSLIENGVVPA